jgi:hypothetical protein
VRDCLLACACVNARVPGLGRVCVYKIVRWLVYVFETLVCF